MTPIQQASASITQLVGSVDGILQSFPATNADGTANAAAQNAAVQSLVKGLIDSGMFQIPAGITAAQIETFAPVLVGIIAAYKVATGKVSL